MAESNGPRRMTTDNQFGGASHHETGTPEQSGAATREDAVNLKERAPDHSGKWIPVAQELPPEGYLVLTKIGSTERLLRRTGCLWFGPLGAYNIYPTPTHWARD